MKKKHTKTLLNAIVGLVGFVVLIGLYLFLFGGDEAINTEEVRRDSDSWKNFKTEVVKKEYDVPDNRGDYVDETLKKAHDEKVSEEMKVKLQKEKGRVKIKNSDLSVLLNDRQEESVESNDEKQTDAYHPQNKKAGIRTKVKKAGKTYNKSMKGSEVKKEEVATSVKKRRKRKKAPGTTLWDSNPIDKKMPTQSFEALIHEDQKTNSSGGKQITIRFLKPTHIGDSDCIMKANQLYSARIVGVRGNRLELKVTLTCEDQRYVYEAWDDDGEKGIYINDLSVDENTGKGIVDNVIGEGAQKLSNTLGVGAVTNVVSSLLSSRGKKALQVTVSSGKKVKFVRS